MVSLKFKLKGKEFIATAQPTIDPREVVYDLEKEVLSIASKEGTELPEKTKKYLVSRIAKALIEQYPVKGDEQSLELNPLEIGG